MIKAKWHNKTKLLRIVISNPIRAKEVGRWTKSKRKCLQKLAEWIQEYVWLEWYPHKTVDWNVKIVYNSNGWNCKTKRTLEIYAMLIIWKVEYIFEIQLKGIN